MWRVNLPRGVKSIPNPRLTPRILVPYWQCTYGVVVHNCLPLHIAMFTLARPEVVALLCDYSPTTLTTRCKVRAACVRVS